MASACNGYPSSCCYNLVVLWCCCCFLCFFTPGSDGQLVPGMYVFGDSLADVGNNNHLPISLFKANFPHNGIDFPGGKATGRFSNGKNTADFLAEKVGLPTSPPYLSLTSISNKSEAFLRGVSFASGGAGILDGTANNLEQCLPLNKQIEYYSTVYVTLVQQLGNGEAQMHLSKSLFALVIGSNDLLGFLKSGSHSTPQQFVNSLVSTLGSQLKRIYNLGARKLAFIGAGPIGCCPSQRNQNKTGECNAEANYLAVKYNEGVRSLLQAMKSELTDLSYSFFDTSSALLQYIQKPAIYGFTEVKAACCGLGDMNARVACLPISSYCSNRKDHIFWDFVHPTESVYRMLTENAFEGAQPFVNPMNVRQLIAV